MCVFDSQQGVNQRVGPQGPQGGVGEAVQVLWGAKVQRQQHGAPFPKKAAQRAERASINSLRNWRERERLFSFEFDAHLWRLLIGRRLGSVVPGGEAEAAICPRLSSLLLKVDCSTVSPLHLSSFTCSPERKKGA